MVKGLPLSIVLAGIVFAFYVMDFYFMSQHDRKRKKDGKGWSWDYTLFTLIIGLLILLQPVFLPVMGFSTDANWGVIVQTLGGISVLLSFWIHIWARLHLRHFYTERVEIQPDHKVINTGPYAFVRHPLITSFFLLAGGIFLLNPALTTFAVFVYTLWSFGTSAKEEDKVLSLNVPGYSEYLKHTPSFLPRLWKN